MINRQIIKNIIRASFISFLLLSPTEGSADEKVRKEIDPNISYVLNNQINNGFYLGLVFKYEKETCERILSENYSRLECQSFFIPGLSTEFIKASGGWGYSGGLEVGVFSIKFSRFHPQDDGSLPSNRIFASLKLGFFILESGILREDKAETFAPSFGVGFGI